MKSVSLLVLVVLVCFVSFSSGTRYTVSFQGLVGRLCGSGSPSGCPDSSAPFISASPSPGFPTGSQPASRSSNPSASFGASSSTGASAGASSSTGASTGASSSTGASTGASRSIGASFSTNPTSSTGASTGASSSTGASTGASSSTGASTGASSSTGASTGASSSTGASGSSFGPSSTFGVSPSSNPSGVSSSSNANSGSISTSACPVCPVCPTQSNFPSQSNFPTFSRAASTGTVSFTATRAPSVTASPSPNPCGPQYEAATTNSFGVGLLFDRTTWARDNGNPAVLGALYAINQINAAGGIVIGGRNISLNPIFYDTQGLPNNTVEGARSLIGASCVSVLIGTDDSSQRRAVQQSILDSTAASNAAPGLLLNPQPYPGADVNLGVINFGANLLTNTRHAIDWAFTNNKTHIHLLGSDDVDSRLINSYARQYITNTYPGILIIGEDYIPVGASEFTAQQTFLAPLFIGAHLFDDAAGNRCPNNTACTMALSTVNGQAANRILFSALAARYLTPNNPNIPYVVMSLRNGYYEALNFSLTNQNNQLIGSNYLDQVDAVANSNIASWKTGVTTFIRGSNLLNDTRLFNLTTGPELNAYNAIRLWANAVAAAGTANPSVIRTAITNATFNSPAGQITVNATSRQATTAATTPFYISRITNPPLRGLVNTVVATYNDPFVQYAPAVGNLTSPQSYATVVSGIRNYYLNTQNATYQSVSLGWEYPAIPSPTS